ncbi:MAG: MarC family protein [Candidatus Omnitrophica bacterium]|nr:MarC family protein [Candidatus Omnitrophota bacterium]MBD3268830.1 MarC family protein [Candidatus Omnitrophota bacterium]
MSAYIIPFMVLLNPFALFIYLNSVIEELPRGDFFRVLVKATGISFIIFSIFAVFGTAIFEKIWSIRFESFRIFGGIVITAYALIFIIQGRTSFFTLKGTLDDLAAEIALPFMVGAATVSLSVVIGNSIPLSEAILAILIPLLLNIGVIMLLIVVKYDLLRNRTRVVFDKVVVFFLRLNGFFVGAIGVNLIITGLENTIKG